MTPPDNSWLQWVKIKLGLRDNEYDTGMPGEPREMKGLLASLPPEKQRAALRYSLNELLMQCDADAPITEEERAWLNAPAVGRELI